MTRAYCRRCGKPKSGLERWCSVICRLLDQGKVKPEETEDSWDLVTKTTTPAPWGQR